MGRKAGCPNQSYYHYRLNYYNDDDVMLSTEYFISIYDICNKFDVTYRNCSYIILKGKVKQGKFKNYEIIKVKEPIYKSIKRTINEITEHLSNSDNDNIDKELSVLSTDDEFIESKEPNMFVVDSDTSSNETDNLHAGSYNDFNTHEFKQNLGT